MSQDSIFLDYEGDNWFLRNKNKITSDSDVGRRDPILFMLEEYNIKPKRVLDIGCSNGWRLNLIQKKYDSECVGIEPSLKAIEDGKNRYPKLKFHHGTTSKLPIKSSFDLVLISFVFHWIAREELLKSVAEIDIALEDDGFLIINDFAPDVPTRALYHHLPKENVYTYKNDYPSIFISTALYFPIGRFTFSEDSGKSNANINSSTRAACTLLKKSSESFSAGV